MYNSHKNKPVQKKLKKEFTGTKTNNKKYFFEFDHLMFVSD